VPRAEFADTLGRMRDWLDRNGRPLVGFETEGDASTIVIRVQFDDDALGDAFAQEFGGGTAVTPSSRPPPGAASADR
jgi:hypothetical protein